ncbi:hypothetical protein [Halarcobacter anaerophilus]|uniref:Uncharacterized protein n=1 Tax=Halarcobacter anaerophilus TaxID=877500 RepID=A0A4Q0XZ39_9BACT|nr:hypothetical protein [Halarcobacter anaerophilus]QDF29930.1 putative membrane protein [Halarcobacter anaerophilus]RXJ62892.1 hypothetical protein CRV06_08640 [Halarcobacter anaerophilus]
MINKLKKLWSLILFFIGILNKFWRNYFLTNKGYVRGIIKLLPLKYSRKILRFFRRKYIKITSLSDIEHELLLNSLNNSSNKSQILLNTYITFLLFCIVTIASISAKDIFVNTGFKFFTFDISLTTYEFTLYTSILVVFAHIFVVESLLGHYIKVYSFTKYSFKSKKIQEKLLYLNPFSFNHISLYSKRNSNNLSFRLLTFFQILMFLPIILLIQVCFISSYPIVPLFFILIIGIVNIILSFRIYSNALTFIPQYFLMVFFVIYAAFEILSPIEIQNLKGTSGKDSKYTYSQKLFPLKYINDIDLTPMNPLIHDGDYAKDAKGLYVNNRDIRRIVLSRIKLGNSVFSNTDFNSVEFNKAILINNRFYNTYFNFVNFNDSFLDQINIIGEYSDYYMLGKRRDDSKVLNSNFNKTNIINSKFQYINFGLVNFYSTNIIYSEFNNNEYENFFIFGGTVVSTRFNSNTFGLDDKKYFEKIKELENQEFYKKFLKNKDFSDKERYERINRLKLNLKEEIFDRVTFVDSTFADSTFKNCKIEDVIFINVTFKNTKFENCLFSFRNKEELDKSNILLQKINSTKTNVLIVNNEIVDSSFL